MRPRWIATLAVLAAALMPAVSARADDPLPAPTITSPSSPGSDRTPEWSWDPVPAATNYECRLLPVQPAWELCTSPYQADLTTAADGDYEFGVRAVTAGVPGPESTNTYTLDTTAAQPLIKRKKVILKNDCIHHVVDIYHL